MQCWLCKSSILPAVFHELCTKNMKNWYFALYEKIRCKYKRYDEDFLEAKIKQFL